MGSRSTYLWSTGRGSGRLVLGFGTVAQNTDQSPTEDRRCGEHAVSSFTIGDAHLRAKMQASTAESGGSNRSTRRMGPPFNRQAVDKTNVTAH